MPIRPTSTELAQRAYQRTQNDEGDATGDFTDQTTPNASQASELIDDVVTGLAPVIGDEGSAEAVWPQWLKNLAKQAVIRQARVDLELSFYANESAANPELVDRLQRRADTARADLVTGIERWASNETGDGGVDEIATAPSSSFSRCQRRVWGVGGYWIQAEDGSVTWVIDESLHGDAVTRR